MPTRRTFDLVVLTTIFLHPVLGLYKMWATRKATQADTVLGSVAGGTLRIVA
jgi:hypothetical protein